MGTRKKSSFARRHALSLTAGCILILWIVLYSRSDPQTHVGSFFGNAVADWLGLVVMVLATKHLYERGSAESKQLPKTPSRPLWAAMRAHSLTIFLLVTGIGWVILFGELDANSKWGQAVGNIVSEWTQILGLVLLTKRLIETHSKESRQG